MTKAIIFDLDSCLSAADEPGHQVLLVGDNHDSEIAIGARLGLRTVQTLRPGVPRSPAATHHIQTLQELKPLLAVKG
jgi:FMN phosphatase YigB (HAD superfamily)